MRLNAPFGVVTPTMDGEVLSVLAGADSWFTISTINRMLITRSPEGVRRVVARLAAEGIVDEQSAGRANLYRLNRDHLAAPAIIELAGLRSTFLKRIRTELESWETIPAYAAIFGSAAVGGMSTWSDIDIFLLQPSGAAVGWNEDVHALTSAASRWTGNDVRILELSIDEVRGRRDLEPVLGDIAESGVTILGDPITYRRLIEPASRT